jgi:hypothetical protein
MVLAIGASKRRHSESEVYECGAELDRVSQGLQHCSTDGNDVWPSMPFNRVVCSGDLCIGFGKNRAILGQLPVPQGQLTQLELAMIAAD